MTVHISSRAVLKLNLSISLSTLDAAAKTISLSSLSGPSSFPAGGTIPSLYFSIIDTVLLTRFPRSFARSEFILFNITSLVKTPSWPKVYSLSKKYLRASTPYLSISFTGSTMLPLDLDIFPPSNRIHPCPSTFLGSGSERDISIAGQIIVWNLTISFPTR